MRRICTVLALLALALASLGRSPALAATDQLDQQNAGTPELPALTNPGDMWSQTYTAGVTGSLDRVSLCLTINSDDAAYPLPPLTVAIYRSANGLPTGSALVSTTVSPPLPVWFSYTWTDISLPMVAQAAGSQYAIVLSESGDPNAVVRVYGWCMDSVGTYGGGQAARFNYSTGSWGTPAQADFLFATYVSPAPTSKDQCANGGYADLIDPRTGQPFKNAGQCTSYVALHQP